MAKGIVYSIPRDGEILRESHLRNHSAFLLSEAGGAWRGAWGVFRPVNSEGDVNQVSVESRGAESSIVVNNLAAVSPDGFVIRSASGIIRNPLPADASAHRELVVCVKPAWTSERNTKEWLDHGPTIKILSATDSTQKQEGPYMELARVDTTSKRCFVTAPALGIDATEQLRSAWESLCVQIKHLAAKLINSQRGELFARLSTNSSLNQVLSLPINCDPQKAGWILADAFSRYENFLEVFANDHDSDGKEDDSASGARSGANEFTKAVEQCFEASGGNRSVSIGTDRLVTRLIELANLLRSEIDGSTGAWLSVAMEELGCVGESRDGPRYIKRVYKFSKKSAAKSIRLEAWTSQGSLPSIAGLKFDTGELIEYGSKGDFKETQGKIHWHLERPKGVQQVTVRCPRNTKTRLIVASSGE